MTYDFLLQNSKSPKCKSIHYTRRSWWALAGNKIRIRGRWERLAMKKVPWKKQSWFGQRKEQDIAGKHKILTKTKHKNT